MVDGSVRRFNHTGVAGQPEVVIGAKIQHLLSVHQDLCPLCALNDPFLLEKSGLPDRVEFRSYALGEFLVHLEVFGG